MRRRRQRLEVSTFPFLAVLLCAMGSLILLLLVIDRRARAVALARATARARRSIARVEEENARREAARKAEWERRRRALHDLLAHQDEELREQLRTVAGKVEAGAAGVRAEDTLIQDLERRLRAERDSLSRGEGELAAGRTAAARKAEEVQAARQDLVRLAGELQRLEQTIEDLKRLRQRQQQTYSLVPYRGKHGDGRRPIYVECTADSLIFHPEHVVLQGWQVTAAEVLAEVRRQVARQGRANAAVARKKEDPYLLLLVRPDGITTYYKTLAALVGFRFDFGYEFVERDWVLDFSEKDDRAGKQPWMSAGAAGAPQKSSRPAPSRPGLAPRTAGMAFVTGTSGTVGPTGAGPAGATVSGLPGAVVGPQGTGRWGGGGTGSGPPTGQNPGAGSGVGPSFIPRGAVAGRNAPEQLKGFVFGPGPIGGHPSSDPGPVGLAGRQFASASVGPQSQGVSGAAPAPPWLVRKGESPAPGQAGPGINGGGLSGPAGERGASGQGRMDRAGNASSSPAGMAQGTWEPRPLLSSATGGSGEAQAGSAGTGSPGFQGGAGTSGRGSSGATGGSGESGEPASATEAGSGRADPANHLRGQSSGMAQGTRQPGPRSGSPEGEVGEGPPGTAGPSFPQLLPRRQGGSPVRRPPPPLSHVIGNRDWIIPVECTADRIILRTAGMSFPAAVLRQYVGGDHPVAQAVRQMIVRRQATLRRGEPPYRPMIRFQVRPDGQRTYYLAYPLLEGLHIPMARQDLEAPKPAIRQ
jgi:hypothetical protein